VSPKRAKKKVAARRAVTRPAKRKAATSKAAGKRSAKPAKKRAAAKPAKKRAAARPARKRTANKRAAPKSAKKRGGKPPMKRPAVKPAKKKSAARKRPVLKVVARPAPPPAKADRGAKASATKKPASPRHKPFGGAIAGASAKDLALFDLVRARVEIHGAIQGMLAASAEVPVGEGKWNPRQIVLHLHYWDREMLPYVEPAYLHNQRPPHTKDDILAENLSSQQDLAGHDWEVAKRLMQQSRESVIEALQSLPEEPAEMWSAEHALGWLIRILSHHDRHHAAVIKDARTRTGSRG
jgi:hypothetical protein